MYVIAQPQQVQAGAFWKLHYHSEPFQTKGRRPKIEESFSKQRLATLITI
jgi:hypothetical protein